MLKQTIKHLLSSLPFIKTYLHGKAIILMLHRIAPIDLAKLPENEGLKVDPIGLEDFIQEALEYGYRFISLDDLYISLKQSNFQDSKNLIITLDDGYKDNLTYGLPIFKKYQIPFCTYLCTGFLDKPNMWWYSVEDFLLSHSSFVWNNKEIDISTIEKKSYLFLQIREYILKNMTYTKSAKQILEKLKIPHDEYAYSQLALNQDDIHKLLEYKNFTLGCHTNIHPVFNNLSFSELREDIDMSLKKIRDLFGIQSEHFCFPFGSNQEINQEYCEFIQTFNFKTAVTTRNGTIYPQHKNFCHVLPRIYIKNSPKLQDLIQFRKKRISTY